MNNDASNYRRLNKSTMYNQKKIYGKLFIMFYVVFSDKLITPLRGYDPGPCRRPLSHLPWPFFCVLGAPLSLGCAFLR